MAGNQEDFLSDRDLVSLAKEWIGSLVDAGQPSSSTYEPPTYPQYSPDPTKEEPAMAMLDSDEQIMGPGVGNLLMLLHPWMRGAKGATATHWEYKEMARRNLDQILRNAERRGRAKSLAQEGMSPAPRYPSGYEGG